MASHRNTLVGGALALSALSNTVACQQFGDGIRAVVLGATPNVPSGAAEHSPSPSETPLAASASPSASGGVSPVPSTSPDGSGASPTPSPTSSSTSAPLVSLVRAAENGAIVSDIIQEPPTVLLDGAQFTVSSVDVAAQDTSLIFAIQSATADLSAYRSNARAAREHLYWNRLASSASIAAETARARIAIFDALDGRYLVSGKETTSLPSELEFVTFSTIDGGTETSGEYNDDASGASAVSYTTQYIAGGPYETQIFSLPASATIQSDKTVLRLTCGAGMEQYKDELYGWKSFVDWVKGNSAAEFAKRFTIVYSFPDSRLPFSVGETSQDVGVPRFQILVGHSMGGLRSRVRYATLSGKNLCPGVITLGSANRGTPLAVPKWKRMAFASQPTPTLLAILDAAAMNNVFGAFRQLSLTRRVSDAIADLSKTATDGNLSMAPNETEFGIPSASFVTRFSFGLLGGIPIAETIGSADKRVLRFSASGFANDPAGAAVPKRRDNGIDYINEIEALEQYEKNKGCATVPHLITYAGYVSGASAVADAHDFFERAKTLEGLTAIIRDTALSAQNTILRWLALSVNAIMPSASGRKSLLSDGLVRTEDAHLLAEGAPIGSTSSDGSFQHSDSVIASRKSPMVRASRTFVGDTHLDLLLDNRVLSALASDIIMLDDEIQAAKTTTLSVADKKSIYDRITADFSGTTKLSWSYTTPYPTYFTRYDRTDPPYGDISYSAKGPNKAAVSFCTHTLVYTVVTGWLSLTEKGTNYEGWQCYTVPTMKKVGNEWYYAKGTRYSLKGGFLSYDPGSPSAP